VSSRRPPPITARIAVALGLGLGLSPGLLACAPRVQIEAPKEPIVIQLNVKIEHEVRIKVDRDLEDLFASEKELF
jgi:hypothetical protein